MAAIERTRLDISSDFEEDSKESSEIESPFDDSDHDRDYIPSEDENNAPNTQNLHRTLSTKRKRSPSPEEAPKGRWRQSNEQCYPRSKRKTRRNLGQEYVSDKTKKTVAARELGSPCKCKMNCRQKLQGLESNIFNEFWNLGSWELQNSYLFGCIDIVKKKRSYRKKQKRRESSRVGNAVYLINVSGESFKVCKTEFVNVHGLQKSKGRLNNIVSKKIKGLSIPEKDKRGKHGNRPNKINDQQRQSVMDHINSIPKYQSHYSRNENISKVYLNSDITIARLYIEKYLPWCQEKGFQPVLQHIYRKIFCTQFNIGFKLPKSDTCKTCDELNIKLETATLEKRDQDILALTTELNLHKAKAKAMQQLLKQETEESEINRNKCVISFDLQQAMPIPKLTTGPAFYCRKIWMYNLGVHDCTNNRGYMFAWTENEAKRGSDEVASIIFKFLSTKPDVEDLVVFTDNCPGQNKNWLIMSLWLQLIKEQKFKTITHHFLVSGHTHLPSDRDFALIEKHQRKYAPVIYSPSEWHQVIQDANKKRPFILTIMQQKDFLDFQPILGNIKKNLHTDDGDNLNFSNIFSFQFRSENTKVIYTKHFIHGLYQPVTVNKKGRPVQTLLSGLKPKFREQIKIAKKKLDNVKSLLPYIPPIHHAFYNDLQVAVNENQELENNDEEAEIIN